MIPSAISQVAAGSGIPRHPPQKSFEAVEGSPLPYFQRDHARALVSSYFSPPLPSGALP